MHPEIRIEQQIRESPEASLKGIDTACSYGCKRNISFWHGYKLHLVYSSERVVTSEGSPLDVSDRGFPLSACVTGGKRA
jgi:hypothetical protein